MELLFNTKSTDMKKSILLLCGAIFIAFMGYGQITLTSDDFPSVGDGYIYASDENPGSAADPGSSGGNQVWDFTGLSEDFTSTTEFVSPGSTPFGSIFPAANMATNSGDTIFTYMHRDNDKATTLGLVIESLVTGNFVNNYIPGETIADFPLQYQDEWTDEYYFEFYLDPGIPGIDSTRYKSDVTKEVVVDAWGTVTIPLGTFNALRLKEVSTSVDSSWAKVGGIWMLQFATTTTSYFYEWWTNEAPVSPFVASMSSSDNFVTIDDATWVKDVFVGLEENGVSEKLTVYPNPATDHIFIKTGKYKDVKDLRITNNAGQLVKELKIAGGGDVRIDISTFPQGVYHCILVGSEREILSGSFLVRR